MAKNENKAADAAKENELVEDVSTGQSKALNFGLEEQFYIQENSALHDAVEEEQKKREQAEKENLKLKKQLEKVNKEKEEELCQVEELKTQLSEEYPLESNSDSSLVWKDKSGAKFTFSNKAPQRFNFNGRNKSRKDWIKDDQAMEALVNGNSIFIKQIN